MKSNLLQNCKGLYFVSTAGGSETTEFEFGDWGEWTECSTTCGEGRRARVRTCPIDAPLGSVDCTGVLQEIETCNTSVPCPGN